MAAAAGVIVGEIVDRISNLPPEVTGHILRRLPLKDAVKTSVLSTQWRFKWAHHLLQLILDHYFWVKTPYLTDPPENRPLKYSNVLNNILFRHDSPIHKFVLHVPDWIPKDLDIGPWIHFVSAKFVREFTLLNGDRNLRTFMFSSVGFDHLTCLEIVNWALPSLSTTFRGFPCLVSLKLIFMHNDTPGQASKFETLISKCPQLERIDLRIHESMSCITIHAPKLQYLVVAGSLSGFFLKDTETIKTASLLFLPSQSWDVMTEFFSRLSLIETLILTSDFLSNCTGKVALPVEKPNISGKLGNLKSLVLYGVQVGSPFAISFMLSLFHMAPRLQKLVLNLYGSGQAPNNRRVEGDCRFYHLKIVKIVQRDCDSWTSITMQLIKMILLFSPVLEVMTIEATKLSDAEKLNITTQLLQYRRASSDVKIIFKR